MGLGGSLASDTADNILAAFTLLRGATGIIEPPAMRVYVLWRHQHEEFEILGVLTTPEKFQQFVAKKFPRAVVGPSCRGNGEWYMSTPQWEFVASPMEVDHASK